MVPRNYPSIKISKFSDIDVIVKYFQSHPREYDGTVESWMEDILQKSDYINRLVKLQSKKYKVIPCVERLSHANNDVTEYAFMFSIECRSGNILIVHKNVNPDRSTLLFWVKGAAYDKAIREIYDFLQSAEINKRSSLRDGSIDVGNAGIIKYKSINHDDVWSWKRAIKVHTVGYYINI